jgi:mannose-6-phosphate isomerase
VHVEKGDVFFTPAGRLHALGPDIMLAEIQQSSDLTYRVFDFDRPGLDGRMRELHLEDALDALDYSHTSNPKTPYGQKLNTTQTLAQHDCFTTNIIRFANPVTKDLSLLDSFVIYLCTEGNLMLEAGKSYTLNKGEAILVPACLSTITLIPEKTAEVLEIYIG